MTILLLLRAIGKRLPKTLTVWQNKGGRRPEWASFSWNDRAAV